MQRMRKKERNTHTERQRERERVSKRERLRRRERKKELERMRERGRERDGEIKEIYLFFNFNYLCPPLPCTSLIASLLFLFLHSLFMFIFLLSLLIISLLLTTHSVGRSAWSALCRYAGIYYAVHCCIA